MQGTSTQRTRAKRFSLLLLEDGEHYVADWTATASWPSDVQGNWQGLTTLPGRLRLASRSLFFEPDDARVPIVRIPLLQVLQMEALDGTSFATLVASVTKMKPNADDVPYVTDKSKPSRWRFTLPYATMDAFMPLANEQLAAGRLCDAERDSYFDAAEQRRVDAAVFDSSRLVDFGEQTIFDGAAVLVSPLIRESGRLVVTNQRIYYQPLHSISGDVVVMTHPLSAVAAIAKRHCSLRPIGMEVFFSEPAQRSGPLWDAPSALFSFRSQADRDRCREILLQQSALGQSLKGGVSALQAAAGILEGSGTWLPAVTSAWRMGRLDNFTYLLFCNLAAGRSFNDLAQWPVFPWVLCDYSSESLDLNNPAVFRDLCKPIGALNAQRLEMFQRRFRDMPLELGAPFMYGTHYCTPGYVMFWLVRAAPAHMLRLQAGKFDAPDRLFISIADAWKSVTTNPADVKELIPEFFLPNPAFLVNKHNLALGQRQNGRVVGDVELPPWANGSPMRFLACMRAALESPVVSANLHHWLDLIFGAKQQGKAAAAADNVFHPLTYHGATDIDQITDSLERAAVEAQVNEFGQCPRQLFSSPHPQRSVCHPAPDPDSVFGGDSAEGASGMLSLALLSVVTAVAGGPSETPTEPDAATQQKLQQLDMGRGRTSTESLTKVLTEGAPVETVTASSAPGSIISAASKQTAAPSPSPTPSSPGAAETSAPGGGWGLPATDVLTKARGGVQGLRTWSSKRLGQLGSSLAETVETVKVKGADVARGAMTRYPSGGGAPARGTLTALRGVPRAQGLSADDVQESPEELSPLPGRS